MKPLTAIQKGELKSSFPYGSEGGEFNENEERIAVFSLIKKMGHEHQIDFLRANS